MSLPPLRSMHEYRFLSTAMFLLRRLPRDAANFLDVSCGFRHVPYRPGWNQLRRGGATPGVFWIYLSREGSRVTQTPPEVAPEDIHEITFPEEDLDRTIVWTWLASSAPGHPQPEWAHRVVDTIRRADRDFDDPPSERQIMAAARLALHELRLGGGGASADPEPEALAEFLLRKYLALEVPGESTALILAQCVGEAAARFPDPMARAVTVRQEWVERIDQLIADRRGQPPGSHALMTHLASLYGFVAMKITQALRATGGLPPDVDRRLRRSDAYIDERLVSDVQTPTIEAAVPFRGENAGGEDAAGARLKDAGPWDAPGTDLLAAVRDRYWPFPGEPVAQGL